MDILKTKIKEILQFSDLIVTAFEYDSLSLIVKKLQDHKIGSIAILNISGEPIGIFTERDILNKIVDKGLDLQNEAIEVHMTKNPVFLSEEESIGKAAIVMRDGHFRHILVTDKDNKLSGVISSRAILHRLIESYKE